MWHLLSTFVLFDSSVFKILLIWAFCSLMFLFHYNLHTKSCPESSNTSYHLPIFCLILMLLNLHFLIIWRVMFSLVCEVAEPFSAGAFLPKQVCLGDGHTEHTGQLGVCAPQAEVREWRVSQLIIFIEFLLKINHSICSISLNFANTNISSTKISYHQCQ